MFDEARRALEQQASWRDELRSRAAALVTTASIVTALLGTETAFDGWGWLAIGAFASVIAVAVYVLLPRPWMFVVQARRLLDEYVEAEPSASLARMHRDLALHFEDDYRANAKRLSRMAIAMYCEAILIVIETGAWLINLGGRA